MVVFWGAEIQPSKPFKFIPDGGQGSQLHLSQATLGLKGLPEERVLLSVEVSDATTPSGILICSLTVGGVDSCPLDLIFDEEVTFKVVGSTSVHLTGYYMPTHEEHYVDNDSEDDEDTDDMDDMDDEDDSDDMDDEYDSEMFDSDDEPQEIVRNSGVVIQEIHEEIVAASTIVKVPQVTFPDENDEEEAGEGAGAEAVAQDLSARKGTKKDKKEKDKKAAAQNGGEGKLEQAKGSQAGAAKVENAEEDEDGFFVAGKRPAEEAGGAKQPKKKQAVTSSGNTPAAVAVTESRVEQNKTEVTPEPAGLAPGKKTKKNKKADKAAAAAAKEGPASAKGKNETAAVAAAAAASPQEVPGGSKGEAGLTAGNGQSEGKKGKGKKVKSEGSEQGLAQVITTEAGAKPGAKAVKGKPVDEKTTPVVAPGGAKTTPVAASAGAKTPDSKEKAGKAKNATPAVRRFPNGLEVHEVALGKPSGKQAAPGKRIFMHYTGRLKSNGKQFDSSIGKKPFSFRLGVGEVIKGWDVGVQGMRVGDKRKLVIPPQMGYGPQGMPGAIPGNATLLFDVELVDVK